MIVSEKGADFRYELYWTIDMEFFFLFKCITNTYWNLFSKFVNMYSDIYLKYFHLFYNDLLVDSTFTDGNKILETLHNLYKGRYYPRQLFQ